MYLAGGISAAINVSNAVSSGLIHREFKEKCVPIGSGALTGTARYSVHPEEAEEVVRTAKYVELGGSKRFNDRFLQNLDF